MINIVNKVDCCGCEACYNACPNESIRMKSDEEGFLYPQVNQDTCVNCGLCEKVCPISNCETKKMKIRLRIFCNIRMMKSAKKALLVEHLQELHRM